MANKVKITPHLTLPIVTILALVVLQIFAPARTLTYVLAVLLGAVGISYYWARQLAGKVSLERTRRYGWAQVGDIVQERFMLSNDSWLPVLWAEVRDGSTLPGYAASRVTRVRAEAQTRWQVEGECRQRGVFTLGPLQIVMGDPFGFFTVTVEVSKETSFVVYPVIAALPPIELPRGRAPGIARSALPSAEATPNVASVRQFTPGDTLRRIHWPTTARRDELYVKDYDREPGGNLWILLDLHKAVQAGRGERSTEEYAVTLAASLADALLRQNRAVGLVGEGADYTLLRPEGGETQLWRILSALASAQAAGITPFGQVIRQAAPILGRGISVTMITPSLDPEWLAGLVDLQQRGFATSVILLDALSFGGRGNVEGLLGLLSERRVPTQVVAQSFRFRPLVEHHQQRPAYKVLGAGRAVAMLPV